MLLACTWIHVFGHSFLGWALIWSQYLQVATTALQCDKNLLIFSILSVLITEMKASVVLHVVPWSRHDRCTIDFERAI
ncbi:MAG: hypothetical protein J3Q66DRAFT_358531, partial [Benniella sp.]